MSVLSAAVPKRLEMILVPQGVHRLPKALMLVGHELIALHELSERRTFPGGAIAFDQVQTGRRQYEETTVDQATVAARFFS